MSNDWDPTKSGHAAITEERGGVVVLHKIVSRPGSPNKIKCQQNEADPLNIAPKSDLEASADKLCTHCWPELVD